MDVISLVLSFFVYKMCKLDRQSLFFFHVKNDIL